MFTAVNNSAKANSGTNRYETDGRHARLWFGPISSIIWKHDVIHKTGLPSEDRSSHGPPYK